MYEVKFFNSACEDFFHSTKRNCCFSGGYGNGKTTVLCQKVIFLSLAFPGYRTVIARQRYSALISTTMESFFLQLPGGVDSPLIESHSRLEKLTRFVNGSEVLWRHLDEFNETTFRGLEVNSVGIDQAEEVGETEYLTLDARIGRWTGALVPAALNPEAYEKDSRGNPRPPSYMMLVCNPDVIGHWIWRRFHPDSPDNFRYTDTHYYLERGTDERAYSADTIRELKTRDPIWQEQYFHGRWGVGAGSIHFIPNDCELHVPESFVTNLLQKSNLYRAMDHGDASPTCCLWIAVFNNAHFVYREYYMPNRTISFHRKEIDRLSQREEYAASYADPSIFKRNQQRNGSFWTLAAEYCDADLHVPPIYWLPADNNEMATRNRINELLSRRESTKHPITGESNAPLLYFIKPIEGTDFGVSHVIDQTKSQKKKMLGSINGKEVYSDERDEKVPDHAYDPLRYHIAMHGLNKPSVDRGYKIGTMAAARRQVKLLKHVGYAQ